MGADFGLDCSMAPGGSFLWFLWHGFQEGALALMAESPVGLVSRLHGPYGANFKPIPFVDVGYLLLQVVTRNLIDLPWTLLELPVVWSSYP